MSAILALARVEARRRWLSLLGLLLLVTLATAVVLVSVVGARRTSTSVQRFREHTAAGDATIQTSAPDQAEQLAARIAELPHVRTVTTRLLVNGFPSGADASTPDFAIYTDRSGRYGREIDRPLVVRGRMPDDRAVDEVLVDEHAAAVLDLDVGDRVHVATWRPEDLDRIGESGGFPGFNGPPLDLTVVGVGRTGEGLGADVSRASLVALAGPGFMDAHPGIGAWPGVVAMRVDEPGRDLPAIAAAVGAPDEESYVDLRTTDELYLDSIRRNVGALATGLWVFALVAGVAALVTVGQAVSRQVAATSPVSESVRALGLTRRQRALASSAPAVAATTIGAVVGIGLAVIASPLLPTGKARAIEVHAGIWIDGLALVVFGIAITMVLSSWAFAVAYRQVREANSPDHLATRPSGAAVALAGAGAPPVIVNGVRDTFERRDRVSLPVRSALVAAIIAVAGIVGAGMMVSSLHSLEQTPTRWGWTWSSEPDAFGGDDPTQQLVDDDRVDAVAIEHSSQLLVDGVATDTNAIEPLRGSIDYTLVSGRLPQGLSEIATDAPTQEKLHRSIGDTVQAVGRGGTPLTLTIVGTTVVPGDAGSSGGAVVTPAALEKLTTDQADDTVLLRYPPHADVAALEQQLADDYGLSFPIFSHAQVPGNVVNVGQGSGVAVGLALFFMVLGVAGLFHALVLSTRNRLRDFAVLRALGFRRHQLGLSVTTQAVTIGLVGLVVGIPVGLVVGRAFWYRLVGDLGVIDTPTTPWVLMALIVPATLLVAIAASWWPARLAAHAPTRRIVREP